MFEIDLPRPETISTLDDDELLDAIALAAGLESVVVACKSVAIDEYARRHRHPNGPSRPSNRAVKRRRRKRRHRRHR